MCICRWQRGQRKMPQRSGLNILFTFCYLPKVNSDSSSVGMLIISLFQFIESQSSILTLIYAEIQSAIASENFRQMLLYGR